ncbi:vWA domain-containing protein [Oceanithermus sp.]
MDVNGELLTSGVVSEPYVTVSGAWDAAGNELYGVQGEAKVCGNITSHEAITAVITLDSTGSMDDSDPNGMRADAAKAFIDRLGPDDKAAVASFDSDTEPSPNYMAIHVWQDFTNDKTLLKNAVDNATFANGATNLWDAVYDDVNLLLTDTSSAEKVALVLTCLPMARIMTATTPPTRPPITLQTTA